MSQAAPERRQGKLEGMAELMPGAVDFVWQAKARAEAARARSQELLAQERQTPARSAEAEAMVLALRDRFGGRPDEEVEREAQARLTIARGPQAKSGAPSQQEVQPYRPAAGTREPARSRPLHTGDFAQPDDEKTADAVWLQFQLAQVPSFNQGALGMAAAGGERYSRAIWRAALAAVLHKPPKTVSSPVGLLKGCCRGIAQSGVDPRLDPGYCASTGWGAFAYRVAGVTHLIHLPEGCRCG